MSPQFIIIVLLLVMLFAIIKLNYYKNIIKGIVLEDKIHIDLAKPLMMKDYKKIFGEKFEPFALDLTTDINIEIFNNFEKFKTVIELLGYKQPTELHFAFVNKMDGYIYREKDNSYEFIVKDDFIPFTTTDKYKLDIFKNVMVQKFSAIQELNIEGTIFLNGKPYFLKNLTSISSYKNNIGRRTYSELVFNFGLTTESVRFNTFKDSFDYLFNNDESDIRLIQKIANSSLINMRKGDGQ